MARSYARLYASEKTEFPYLALLDPLELALQRADGVGEA
jgi:hypothetical protein